MEILFEACEGLASIPTRLLLVDGSSTGLAKVRWSGVGGRMISIASSYALKSASLSVCVDKSGLKQAYQMLYEAP